MWSWFLSAAFAVTPASPDSLLADGPAVPRLSAELGFVTALSHTIQYGKDGALFDYAGEGGQANLFPYARFQADLDVGRSTFALTWQPLDLRTEVVAERDLRIDGVDFAAGTPLDVRYGFTFYRGTWLYDLDPGDGEIAIGLAFQLRNAVTTFTTADGAIRSTNRDVGPVPLLAARGRWSLGTDGFVGAEITGFYAPIKYINGTGSDVVGAIADGQIRVGRAFGHGADGFVGLRYVGGGAEGTARVSTPPGDGFTKNWLHLLSVQIGAVVR